VKDRRVWILSGLAVGMLVATIVANLAELGALPNLWLRSAGCAALALLGDFAWRRFQRPSSGPEEAISSVSAEGDSRKRDPDRV
jgi:hypothetical protein